MSIIFIIIIIITIVIVYGPFFFWNRLDLSTKVVAMQLLPLLVFVVILTSHSGCHRPACREHIVFFFLGKKKLSLTNGSPKATLCREAVKGQLHGVLFTVMAVVNVNS
jgi:hypothetical protein